jgi:hypothetical protein
MYGYVCPLRLSRLSFGNILTAETLANILEQNLERHCLFFSRTMENCVKKKKTPSEKNTTTKRQRKTKVIFG